MCIRDRQRGPSDWRSTCYLVAHSLYIIAFHNVCTTVETSRCDLATYYGIFASREQVVQDVLAVFVAVFNTFKPKCICKRLQIWVRREIQVLLVGVRRQRLPTLAMFRDDDPTLGLHQFFECFPVELHLLWLMALTAPWDIRF